MWHSVARAVCCRLGVTAPCGCACLALLHCVWAVQARVSLKLSNLASTTMAHIHGGPNGYYTSAPVLVAISNSTMYKWGTFVVPSGSCWPLLSGNAYINIHTVSNAGGE